MYYVYAYQAPRYALLMIIKRIKYLLYPQERCVVYKAVHNERKTCGYMSMHESIAFANLTLSKFKTYI
jgi:hypothetical protein